MPRDLKRPDSYIPPPPSKSARDRSWERAQQGKPGVTAVTFRRIPLGVRDEINRIAQGIFVNRDEVARAILEAGLAAYLAGDVTLDPELIRGRFYLFAENAESE